MASAPTPNEPSSTTHRRSRPNSRPTTPLRRSSRTSASGVKLSDDAFPLNALEPAIAELADGMAALEANFGDLQIMHESLSRFNESFASFLYGLNMNAFCVDFPEAPIKESFQRAAEQEAHQDRSAGLGAGTRTDYDAETTFMTNDTSFVNEPPPPSAKPTPFKTPVRRGGGVPRVTGTRGGRARGGSGIARGRGISFR